MRINYRSVVFFIFSLKIKLVKRSTIFCINNVLHPIRRRLWPFLGYGLVCRSWHCTGPCISSREWLSTIRWEYSNEIFFMLKFSGDRLSKKKHSQWNYPTPLITLKKWCSFSFATKSLLLCSPRTSRPEGSTSLPWTGSYSSIARKILLPMFTGCYS